MREVALGDLIEPSKVRRAGSGNYPILSMTMHEGLVDQGAKFKKRVASEDTSDYKVVTKGQLVVGFPIDEGVLDFQTLYDSGIVSPAYSVWDVTHTSHVHIHYLKRFLRSTRALTYYKTKLRGSTARRRSLPAEIFLALPVPLPSVEEQRRITAILDQADSIRVKRRQVLACLDSLTQSIFHDMFCNVGRTSLLGDLGLWRSGGTPPRSQAPYFNGDIPWFSSGELGSLFVSDSVERVTAEAIRCTSVKEVLPGSIMVGMYDTAALKSSINTKPASCNQAVAFAKVDSSLANSIYVYFAIQAVRMRVLSQRRGIRQKNLNLTMIREIRIPLAPISDQREFATRVERVHAYRPVVQRALDADNELFASLQGRAYWGEL